MRRCANAMVCTLAMLMAQPALADAGDKSIGVLGAFDAPNGARGGVAGELGVADMLAARLEASFGERDHVPSAQLIAGPTLAWDVVQWVPAITLAGGAEHAGDSTYGIGVARLEIRRYLQRQLWVSAGIGGTYRQRQLDVQALASVFWHL